MKTIAVILAAASCLAASPALAAEFETQVLEGVRTLDASVKETQAAGLLREATALRQQLRRELLEKGVRLMKEKTGEASGDLSGNFLGFSGQWRQERHDLLVKGGEVFGLYILTPVAKALAEAVRSKPGLCPQMISRRLEPLASRSVEPADVERLKGELKRFQRLLDSAELHAASASEVERQRLRELSDWGRNSLLRVVLLDSNAFSMSESEWYSGGGTAGSWWVLFQTPGVGRNERGLMDCRNYPEERRIDNLLRNNLKWTQEEFPIY